MDQTGLWKLFFATGLPEAYLAARTGGREGAPALPPGAAPVCGVGGDPPPERSRGAAISP